MAYILESNPDETFLFYRKRKGYLLIMMQELDRVPSTMDVARANILSGQVTFDPQGRSRCKGVIAQEQFAGRGQRGRAWHAAPGESLCATYYFRRGLTSPQTAGEIAFLAGVAVVETLQRLTLASRLPVRASASPDSACDSASARLGLKWPNDVLLNEKKMGGILVEMVQAPDKEWVALIGVGLNVSVRAFPPDIAPYATSLCLEGIAPCPLPELGRRIADSLQAQADLRRDFGFSALLQRWRAYDQTAGRRYEADVDGLLYQGIAEGVDATGALQLRLDDGQLLAARSASTLRELSASRP